MKIETEQDWWSAVKINKKILLNLILKYHPYYLNPHNHHITAQLAEEACQVIRDEIVKETEKDPECQFNEYLETQNGKLASLLENTWFGMPESYESRCEEGFGVLCDLCSESWVLFNDEPMNPIN
jgi:hypothetical protein